MKIFVRHPIFPIIVLIFSVQLIGEHYPFSPFSMFSNPSTKPHHLFYLADNEGDPLPLTFHTGMSAARLTKMFKSYREKISEGESEKYTEQEVEKMAGEKLIKYLTKIADSRGEKRRLPLSLQLMELEISFDKQGLREDHRTVMKFDP